MFTSRQTTRAVRSFAALSAAILLGLPGVASADELMLSEITVVAVALDTQSAPKEIAEELNEAALENVREAIEADTEAYLAAIETRIDEPAIEGSDES
ncbi:MAG: hypothetical protein AAFX44_15915 [Pseudomonadota bacterium]